MKKIVIALVAALPLLAFAPAAHAGDQNPQHVCGTPQKPCGNWKTQWIPTGETEWVQKPKYKAVKKWVPSKCEGECPKQKPEIVNVPPAEPKTVIREQVINVVTVPRVVYHPAPVVNVAPAPCAVANPCQQRSMNPCGSPCQQQAVSPCGPRPCNQQYAAPQQMPTHTQSGLNIHAANTAPQGSKPCTQVINGVTVTGRCW